MSDSLSSYIGLTNASNEEISNNQVSLPQTEELPVIQETSSLPELSIIQAESSETAINLLDVQNIGDQSIDFPEFSNWEEIEEVCRKYDAPKINFNPSFSNCSNVTINININNK